MISFQQKKVDTKVIDDVSEKGEKSSPIPNQLPNQAENKNTLSKFEVTDSDREDYHNLVDILFVIDTTSSMGWCFKEAKNTILDISNMFTKQEFDIRFALSEYRDHPPQDHTFVYKHYNLQQADKMAVTVQQLVAQGGGDGPEAVMDGLYYGLKETSWRKDQDGTASKRFVFHICDAPPHGKQYGGKSSDMNWQEKGCPCKISLEMITNQIKENNVIYNLVECADLHQMVELFKNSFGDSFQETIRIEKQQVFNNKKLSLTTYEASKKSGCIGGGGDVKNMKKGMSYGSAESESRPSAASSNIFNKQIQSNIRKNLM